MRVWLYPTAQRLPPLATRTHEHTRTRNPQHARTRTHTAQHRQMLRCECAGPAGEAAGGGGDATTELAGVVLSGRI